MTDSSPVGTDFDPEKPSLEEAVQEAALAVVQEMFFVAPWVRLRGPLEPFILRSTVGRGTVTFTAACFTPEETLALFQHSIK